MKSPKRYRHHVLNADEKKKQPRAMVGLFKLEEKVEISK
jgi:hypothetical protein